MVTESYNLAKNLVYPRALIGDACEEPPTQELVWDEDDVAASQASLQLQVRRWMRLARLLDTALDPEI